MKSNNFIRKINVLVWEVFQIIAGNSEIHINPSCARGFDIGTHVFIICLNHMSTPSNTLAFIMTPETGITEPD